MSRKGRTPKINDNRVVVDHVLCPYNPITKEIFLKEKQSTITDIYKGGKKIASQQVSTALKERLTKMGFELTRSTKNNLEARKRVFGIKISVQKNYEGKEIRELVISVPSATQAEVMKKREIMINGIKSIVPDLDIKVATADKYVRC